MIYYYTLFLYQHTWQLHDFYLKRRLSANLL